MLTRRQERVERRLLQGHADRIADGRPVAHDVVTRHPGGAGGGREQRGEHVDGGRLAGAVGPQEAVDLAGLDLEVDAVDRPWALLEFTNEALHLDPVLVRIRHIPILSIFESFNYR